MLVSSILHCTAVLIFQLWGVQTFSPVLTCPDRCVCEKTLLVNCTSLDLSKAPSHIPATTTALDLSHNVLHSLASLGTGHVPLQGLQYLWLGNNSLESLSMCSRGIVGTSSLIRKTQRCVPWAPHLQSLSADRNQLKVMPRGLSNIKFLKVLQLSYNRISEIGPADLAGCTHLTELHLHHNLINTIHPEAFKDLHKLKILDVSYNLLATIPMPAYLSLRNLKVLVDISGNRWRCDCNMNTIRRWLSFDHELGNPTWEVVCFSPFQYAGQNLMGLKESDLVCPQPVYNIPGVKKEVIVDEGMELILSCSTGSQDFIHTRWWTPHGQICDAQQFLHISNTTEHDAGLYVCISGYHEEHMSVFNLHVRKRAHDKRLRREAQIGLVELNTEDNDNTLRNGPAVRAVQQSQFELAVCLSVFITFIVAFVLGVILRPFLEKCYNQIRNKRKSSTSASNSQSSSTRQRPYVNEGYSDTDDQEQEVHTGPRVTFGQVTEIQEQGGVPYYVTVEDRPSGSNTDVSVLYENVEKTGSLTEAIDVHKEVPLREENKEITRYRSTESLNSESSKEMQFEYITDQEDTTELGDGSILPGSSLTDKRQELQMSYEARESTEQNVDSPTVSIYEEDEASMDHLDTIPRLVNDPFHLKMSESKEESVDELDPDLWNDSGESFSFTESSPRSSSRVSDVAALGSLAIQEEMSVDELSERPSSCNSSESGESEGGPTEYTVNPVVGEDLEEHISYTEDDFNDGNHGKNRHFEKYDLTEKQSADMDALPRQDTITLDPTDIHMTYTRGDSFDDEAFTEYKESLTSNVSSDYEDEPTQYHVHPVYRTSQKSTSLMSEDRSRTSSYSEEDHDQGDYPRKLEIRLEHRDPSTDATPVISQDRLLNINYDNSSSSTDIEVKHNKENERGIFKGLSRLSARLFNRSGSETNKDVQLEPNTLTTSSKGNGGFLGISFKKQPVMPSEIVNPSTNEDNFFVTIGQAFDRLPKLKNSLLFSIAAPKTPHQQKSTSVEKRISKSERPFESIIGKTEPSLDPLPRVKRYILFSQSRLYPQIKTPSHSAEEIIPYEMVNTESRKSTISTEDDSSAITKGELFFDQIDASIDDFPKVKRYVKFSPSMNVTKTESLPDTGDISIYFNEQSILFAVPKVQRYLQFSQSESQFLYHQSPSATNNQLVRPEKVTKSEFPPDPFSIFFEGQCLTLCTVPKVQRYLQFTQSEPQTVHTSTPDFGRDSFFGEIPISFDEVPKVKQYVQFSPSELQLSNDLALVKELAKCEEVTKSASPADPFSIFYGGRSVLLYAVPKVQRYLQFTQSAPQTMHMPTTPIKGDSFFKLIPISFDKVPNVQRYLQFSQSESQLSNHQSPSATINQVVRPEEVTKTGCPTNHFNIFFDGQSVSLHALPKVQKYVQFRQSAPQTVHTPTPAIEGDSFFKLIPISFKEVPKVKQYVQFKPSESQLSNHSTSSLKTDQVVRLKEVTNSGSLPDLVSIFYEGQRLSLCAVPKVQRYLQFMKSTPQILHTPTPAIKEESFFRLIPISFDEVPKVKRYVQFSLSESQLSNHSEPTLKSDQVVRREEVTKTGSPPDPFNIFFEGQNASLPTLPKVQRYVHFTQSKPKTVHTPAPAIKGNSFFGQIPTSFDEVPKVKRYLQVSLSESQLSNHSPLHNQVAKPEKVSKTGSPTDPMTIFFKGQCASLCGVPKVQRCIQFTLSQTHYDILSPYHPAKAKYPLTDERITQEIKTPLVTGNNNFFLQMGDFLDKVPKVKKYIYFTQSEVPKSQSLSPIKQQVVPSVTPRGTSHSVYDTKSKQGKTNFLEVIQVPLDNIPKVNRSLQFTQFKAEPSNQPIPSFFGQIYVSFDEVPKVKRYLQFTQPELQPPAQCPSWPAITKSVTPELLKNIQSTRSEVRVSPIVKENNFFGQTGTSFDGVPRVKRYIQFTQAEPRLQPPLLHSLNNMAEKPKHYSSELKLKDSVSKDDIKSAADEYSYFAPIDIASEIPKVRRYIQFSQRSTQPSSLSLHRQIATPVLTKSELPRSRSSPDDSKSNNEESFFKKMDASVSELPKVKRYINFTPHSTPPKVLNYHRVQVDVAKKTELQGSDLSTVLVKPSFTGDNFHQLGANLNSLPRVKRYIQFTLSEPYQSNQSQSPLEKMTKKELTKLSPSIDAHAKASTKDIFFDGEFASLGSIPKVKKALLFTQSKQIEVPPQSVTKAEYITSSSLSDKDSFPKHQDNFFRHLGVSFDEVPKVKKYMKFSLSVAYPSTWSSVTTTPVTPQLSSSPDSLFKEKRITVIKDNIFLGQMGTSLEVPKVRRYLQFIKSEPQTPTQSFSSSAITECVTQEFSTKMQSTRSKVSTVSPTTKEDNFFGQTETSLDGVPKVKRYIKFTQAEPGIQEAMLVSIHSLTNSTEKTIHTSPELIKVKSLASEDYIQPAAAEHNAIEITKVRRYINFSQRSTQSSSLSLHRQTATPVSIKPELLRSSTLPGNSKSNNEDTFFKKMDATVSELPKVKRYINFTHHSAPSKSSNTHGVTVDVAKKTTLLGSELSMVHARPFLGTNLDSLPRVKRHIQFEQSKPHPTCQLQSSTEKQTKKEWTTLSSSTNNEAKTSIKDTLNDASLDKMLKEKKAFQLTQSEYQNRTSYDISSNAADHLFGSLELSYDQLPEVKKRVRGVQPEPYQSSLRPSTLISQSNLESERVFSTKEELNPATKGKDSFGLIDGGPRLTRYIGHFRHSEPHTQTLPLSSSPPKQKMMDVITESMMIKTNVTPETVRDQVLQQIGPRSYTFTNSKQYDQNQTQSQDAPSTGKVFTEPNKLSQLSESQTILESKLSGLSASSKKSVSRKHLVLDPALQDLSQSIPDTPAAFSKNDDAREYLRDSYQARQRQERRRLLFQQKKRAMDGFSLSSEYFTSQESDQ